MRRKRPFLTLIKAIKRIEKGYVKMRHALPSRVLQDLIRHPVETVGTRRVAVGHASMGLRVEARKDTKALSTSCESTFIG